MNVASFYRFTDVDDPAALRGRLQSLCDKFSLLGTILVASEGVNGTLAGTAEDVRSVFTWLEERLSLDEPIEARWAEADAAPFRRMRVKVKKEIVTLGRKLAMFCTGGIRCEKATALMLELGFSDVYQLQGGILKYLEDVAEVDNLWHGECFVFDQRIAVDRDRAEGGYVQCHACRRPLSSADARGEKHIGAQHD